MRAEVFTVIWILVSCIVSGGWIGWFAGRRYERSKAALHRMRKRRPFVVNVDYEFAVRAFKAAGYKVEPMQKQLH